MIGCRALPRPQCEFSALTPDGVPLLAEPIVLRGIYIATIVLAVYFNAFVAVTQAFLKIDFLHAFAPRGKERPFLIAQLVTLALFLVIGVTAFRRYRGHAVNGLT